MSTGEDSIPSTFSWNAGGWFGSQIGCTLWLLILGFVLLTKDPLVAGSCIGGFVVLNAWGLFLWRRRAALRAYSGIQRFLALASVIIAIVVVVVNVRGVSQGPRPGDLVSTYLPYWAIAAAPGLMLLFAWRERKAKKGQR